MLTEGFNAIQMYLLIILLTLLLYYVSLVVPAVSPSRGWDVAVNVFDINPPNLPTPFYSVLVPISVFMPL